MMKYRNGKLNERYGCGRCRWLFMGIVAGVLLGGCTSEDAPPAQVGRTLVVWLGGDNDLSDETDDKLASIALGWDGTGGNLVVYQDRKEQAPRLLQLFAGGEYRTLHTYEAQNSCDPEVWSRVLREALAACPAQTYGLLFFSHATGWLPQGNYPNPATRIDPATCTDPATRTIGADGDERMELADFAAAIPDGQFRFIVFEACLMGGIEVAYELRRKSDYLLLSPAEILSPGFTGLYPRLIPLLFGEPAGDEARLTEFAHTYYEAWNAKTGYSRSSTVSLVRTDALEALADAARPLMNNAREVLPADVTYYDSTSPRLYSDLGDYLQQKSPAPEDYLPVSAALDRAVVYTAATPQVMGHPCAVATGLTLYIPRKVFPPLNAAAAQTAWGQAMGN